MAKQHQLEAKFWSALQSDRTMMVGLANGKGGNFKPLTAVMEDSERTIWFFTAKNTEMVTTLGADREPAIATFASKDHDLFATVNGQLRVDNDRSVIERLWNPFIAAWYEGGKDDPMLALLRFDPDDAEIWLNENSFLAGLKMLFGVDPKKDYRDKVATVDL